MKTFLISPERLQADWFIGKLLQHGTRWGRSLAQSRDIMSDHNNDAFEDFAFAVSLNFVVGKRLSLFLPVYNSIFFGTLLSCGCKFFFLEKIHIQNGKAAPGLMG